VSNKTDASLEINRGGVAVVGPDGAQTQLRPQNYAPAIEPGARLSTVLGPFQLPSVDDAAKINDGAVFELVVPMVLRGTTREYRVHMRAKLKKI